MGKKRIVTKGQKQESVKNASGAKLPRRKLDQGILYVQSTFNNTKLLLTDLRGNAIISSSSGALGFKGAKKGTPFAAAKAAEELSEKAEKMGLKEIDVVVKGVGAGRESSIRGFISKGINIRSIKDVTPVPHNGPKPPKPRRV
jgi:small subunit ribosomal protein S11